MQVSEDGCLCGGLFEPDDKRAAADRAMSDRKQKNMSGSCFPGTKSGQDVLQYKIGTGAPKRRTGKGERKNSRFGDLFRESGFSLDIVCYNML